MRAFTLAEVLITLGIIGVVSAMTLPSLINQTQGKELEAGLKKAYATIQSAYNQMTYDKGQIINGINYPTHKFMPIFKKYFKISKDCGNKSCEDYTSDETTGNMTAISATYKTYNNQKMQNSMLDDGQIIIGDGIFIGIENLGSNLYISVDINGNKKKTNRWGHDLFTFQVTDNGKLLPMGAEGTIYYNSECSTTSNSKLNGIGCTYKALTDKDYFKNLPK